ncbi:MAG: sulfite exporter TauE/SafE family protein [Rickettsiales bacterium]|nr:sulfite exporter TauE/SafE family protein [Rickettsiales bacterium]
MFQIYLPIAEMSVNVLLILALGGGTGILSGMFGVGGGFLMTPLLIFIGVPPTVAVATSANQIVAASVSGFATHWKRMNVDFKMGNLLLLGGLVGSTLGVQLFNWLKTLGQIDLVISLSYVVFLGAIGGLMAIESGRAIMKLRKPTSSKHGKLYHLAHSLPLKVRFTQSKLYISAIVPIVIGLVVGVMVSIMGIGGGFFMLPAMIYILGMPTSIVVGTSLYQIIFITANVTLLHSISTQTVDVVLALLLLGGSVVGAQIGSRLGAKLPAEQLRALLAAMVLGVAIKLGYNLFVTPADVYSVIVEETR